MKVSKKLLLENPDKTIRKVFPELFKIKLEVGKWYIHKSGGFWCIDSELDKNGKAFVYGFSCDFTYFYRKLCNTIYLEKETTLKEVETALIKESERRGLISDKPLHYILPYGIGYSRCSIKEEFVFKDNKLYLGNFDIFNNGKWAEIIEIITKEEAEKILNKKIV